LTGLLSTLYLSLLEKPSPCCPWTRPPATPRPSTPRPPRPRPRQPFLRCPCGRWRLNVCQI
jgi:hypothetical protein